MTAGGFNEARAALAELERQGRTFVLEHEAKEILHTYGIPVIQDHFCTSEEEALKAARVVGYPVVVKVVSPQISHKSDVRGVRVGVASEDELRQCYREMTAGIVERLDAASILGVLIEPVAKGCEIFIGTSRDPHFGPLMMFGLGGVFVEVLKDISYGLAPLTPSEAERMVREIRGRPILQGVRGGRGVDDGVLVDVLVKVSHFVTDFPQVEEMDINPLFAEGNRAVVTDARLLLGQATAQESENHQRLDLEKLFFPRSVAVVGATTERYNRGRVWLKRVQEAGYKGNLYVVSRREQVDHWPTYQRISDIPELVDLVMLEVGRDAVPSVLQDCVARGVPWVSIHASGFSDTGTDAGVELERQLHSVVKDTTTGFIGPNAMGPYCPESGIIPGDVTMASGEVAIVSQSGVTFLAFGKVAKEKGFGISKGISYGSEGDARVDGFLNYLAEDPKTKIVAIYIEGVRDGASFLGSLKKLAARKPAIVLKGGVTDAGARAVASHSGAMAGRGEVWPAVFRKAGAIQADNLEEMVDLVLGFLHLGNITGNRLCIVTPSGGAAVMYSDACFRAGFQLPTLREESRANIKNALPPGTNVKNPVDVAQGYFRHEVMQQVLSLVAADQNIDFILFHLPMDVFISTVEHAPWIEEKFFGYLLCGKNHAKPFMVVLPYTVADGKRAEIEQYLLRNGIAVFPTVERALKVVSKLQAYSSVQQDMGV